MIRPMETPASRETEKYSYLSIIGIIAFYCLAYASLRLAISPSMELDESEQYLNSLVFRLGYDRQAPLYGWIVYLITFLSGRNLWTLVAIKYFLVFFFYLSFYGTARLLWDRKESLLIMASLLLFSTYSYEVNRDLSHTVLVSLMSVLTLFFYIRLLMKATATSYLLLGTFIGLGLLSKYNYGLFLVALILASLSSREGRKALFSRRIFLSLLCCTLLLLPHFIWLVRKNFPSLHYALERSKIGGLNIDSSLSFFPFLMSSYAEVILFLLAVLCFFYKDIAISTKNCEQDHILVIVRRTALYSLLTGLSIIFFLRTSHFQNRWLAPVLPTLSLAMFSMFRMNPNKRRFKVFGYLCIAVAFIILIIRAFFGFFPDATGKVERLHIPYQDLSRQIYERLGNRGIDAHKGFALIADIENEYVAANLSVHMPAAKFIALRDATTNSSLRSDILDTGGLFVYDVSKHGLKVPMTVSRTLFPWSTVELVQSSCIRCKTSPPYVLGIIVIQKRLNQTAGP